MMERNFTVKDVAKLGLDATGIATNELGLKKTSLAATLLPWHNGPNAKTHVMNKLVEDTNSMGGDKSYQIDIGV